MKKDYICSPLVSLFGLNSENVQVPRTTSPEAETQSTASIWQKKCEGAKLWFWLSKKLPRERSFGRAGDEIQKNLSGSGTDA